ncbi:MAG: hypothetical protein Ct9H300mP11_22640 [Chloroflexota bacterium]|nr:MAG: hypothetical protein Ct9H300mP11_22640 [Chloroflexota bacterium]
MDLNQGDSTYVGTGEAGYAGEAALPFRDLHRAIYVRL